MAMTREEAEAFVVHLSSFIDAKIREKKAATALEFNLAYDQQERHGRLLIDALTGTENR